MSPEGERSHLGRALNLFGKTVEQAVASDDGALEIAFTDGTVLLVPPDADYEAWQVTGPSGSLAVSRHGGGLATWGYDDG